PSSRRCCERALPGLGCPVLPRPAYCEKRGRSAPVVSGPRLRRSFRPDRVGRAGRPSHAYLRLKNVSNTQDSARISVGTSSGLLSVLQLHGVGHTLLHTICGRISKAALPTDFSNLNLGDCAHLPRFV